MDSAPARDHPDLNMPTILVHFELFNRDIRNFEVLPNEDLDFVKTKSKGTALSIFRQYNKNPQQNFSKEELATLANLSKNKDIIIQKSDKANSLLLLTRTPTLKKWKIF